MSAPSRTRPGSTRRRFARRVWARRWATLRRVLMLLLVVALVAGSGWLVFVSSVLAVERVQVSGARTVPADRISRVAAVPLGVPLARVDVDRVQARVERVPVVEHADISRSWPHTVAIEVTERTAVAAVRSDGGYRLIDAEGVLFRTVPDPGGRLPVMTVGPQPRTAATDAAREAAAVVASLPRRLVRRVAGVQASTMDSIELRLRDGRSVEWGSAESSALKAKVLLALLKRDASVYDVSVPASPTLTVG
jgi:cell division septal protein FtsQ